MLQQCLFNLGQHAPGHLTVTAAVNVQLYFRPGEAQLVEKYIRHVGIKVLSSVQHDFFDAIGIGNGAGDHACFDELWSGADDCEDLLHSVCLLSQ